MSKQLVFWMIFIIWLIFGVVPIENPKYRLWGGNLLIAILLGLLGWALFGAAVK